MSKAQGSWDYSREPQWQVGPAGEPSAANQDDKQEPEPSPLPPRSSVSRFLQMMHDGFEATRRTVRLRMAVRELRQLRHEQEAELVQADLALGAKAAERELGAELETAKPVADLASQQRESDAALAEANARLSQQRDQLAAANAKHGGIISALQAEHAKFAGTWTGLEEKATVLRRRAASCAKSIERLEHEIARAEEGKPVATRLEQLRDQIDDFSKTIACAEQDLAGLQQQMDPARRAAEAKAAELAQARAAWAAAKAELDEAVRLAEVASSELRRRLTKLGSDLIEAHRALGKEVFATGVTAEALTGENAHVRGLTNGIAAVDNEIGAKQFEMHGLRTPTRRFLLITAGIAIVVLVLVLVVVIF